ncbi:MAG: arginine--tRNA ligase [Candidatus Kerfeldbacteria bacterium]|nr:arginine--tRNA ligase [Candidatus Kerfeldbacteria bacterium]
MQTITKILQQKLLEAAVALFEECRTNPPAVRIEIPSDPKYGDYSTNLAMQLAPVVKDGPMRIAAKLKEAIDALPAVDRIEIMPPGFINFFISPAWFARQVGIIVGEGKEFGQSEVGNGSRVLLEFISANPTGPMTLANGRGGFAGDTLANVMQMAGYKTWREFYVNDVGGQIEKLVESVIRRSFQLKGIKVDYPADLYQGEYVLEIAKKLHLERYKLKSANELKQRIKGRVVNMMIADLQRVAEKKLGIKYNRWFRESELHELVLDEKVLAMLRQKDLIYEQDRATWFRTTQFGDDKDRVLVKSDGEKTYFLSDIALRLNRFHDRRFDREILFLGADHHGYQGRMQAAMSALDYPGKLDIFIVQFVRLMKDGIEVKMSKRAGNYVAIEELTDEVGLDAARFFFLMHAASTHMDFDLGLAQEKSEKNPVYYVQYAHARICSIVKKTKGLPTARGKALDEPAALGLIKQLLRLPELVEEVAMTYDVHKLPFYATELATAFHDFYGKVRVIDNGSVDERRLALVLATRQTLATTLKLMGISAPEKM